MSLCNSIPTYDCSVDPFEHIEKATLDASKEVKSGGKMIKMIMKQYRVTEVLYSGPKWWFDSEGKLVQKTYSDQELYKYRIVYEGPPRNGDGKFIEFSWMFN